MPIAIERRLDEMASVFGEVLGARRRVSDLVSKRIDDALASLSEPAVDDGVLFGRRVLRRSTHEAVKALVVDKGGDELPLL